MATHTPSLTGRTPTIFRYARHIIAFTIVIGSFGFLFILMYRSVPAQNKDTINLAVGFVLGLLTGVGAYYFGSSKDKSDADASVRDTATVTSTTVITPPTPPPTPPAP